MPYLSTHKLVRSLSVKLSIAASIGWMSLAFCGAASADTLDPGSTLTISFTASSNKSDLLIFASDWGLSVTGSPTVTTELYDGKTLLGTATAPVEYLFNEPYFESYFSRANDQFTYDSPTAIDTTSLNNRTIDGRLVVSVTGGSISYYSDFYLHDAESCGTGCYTPEYDMNVTNLALNKATAPEPASLSLAGMALIGVYFVGRRIRMRKG